MLRGLKHIKYELLEGCKTDACIFKCGKSNVSVGHGHRGDTIDDDMHRVAKLKQVKGRLLDTNVSFAAVKDSHTPILQGQQVVANALIKHREHLLLCEDSDTRVMLG